MRLNYNDFLEFLEPEALISVQWDFCKKGDFAYHGEARGCTEGLTDYEIVIKSLSCNRDDGLIMVIGYDES
jgi:hypothetical protein